jgi:5-methylcytosine-specific restriction endonuclease McrA
MGRHSGIDKALRLKIFKRDKYICKYCGEKFTAEMLQVDHIIPRAMGGKNKVSNYTTACIRCNSCKGCITLEEFFNRSFEKHAFHKAEARYYEKQIIKLQELLNG